MDHLHNLVFQNLVTSNQAGRDAERSGEKVEGLQRRLDHALLAMEAMWTLLRDRLQAKDEDLVNRMVELDESDGILDGKVRRTPRACPHCRRTIPTRFPRCLYCGVVVAPDPFA